MDGGGGFCSFISVVNNEWTKFVAGVLRKGAARQNQLFTSNLFLIMHKLSGDLPMQDAARSAASGKQAIRRWELVLGINLTVSCCCCQPSSAPVSLHRSTTSTTHNHLGVSRHLSPTFFAPCLPMYVFNVLFFKKLRSFPRRHRRRRLNLASASRATRGSRRHHNCIIIYYISMRTHDT